MHIKDYDIGGVYSSFHIFMKISFQDQLVDMVILTNINLDAQRGDKNYSIPPVEFLEWIGVLILAPYVEFGTSASLLNTQSKGNYLKDPCFVRTGMSQERFSSVRICVILNDQKKQSTFLMTHEAFR